MSASDAPARGPEYLEKRRANQEHWAQRAQRHGTSLSATASTGWVRRGTLRRLRRVLRPDDRVLEVGCGNGNLLGPLAGRCRAYGVDLTTEMLQLAHLHHRDIRGLTRGDGISLPFRDATFDVVYTSRCLINILDRAKQQDALAEILRVVRWNGTVVLSENFSQCVDRLDRLKRRVHAGPIDVDIHNLRLDFDATLQTCRERGWIPETIQGYAMTNFVVHVLIGALTQRRGGRLAQRVMMPVLVALARCDDAVSRWLPHLGKDTTIVLRPSPLMKNARPRGEHP
jgi:ubiquinone/menaquinone biosynthesis C-methylase UbiE